jgi:hypothetical protein
MGMRANSQQCSVRNGQRRDALCVRSIEVKRDRMVCLVQVCDRWHYTTSKLAALACKEYPHMPFHTCVNSHGSTFGDVIKHTSIPHLLEHLVIDLLVQRNVDRSNRSFVFAGTTEWIDEGHGTAQVQIKIQDDIKALQALKDAVAIINNWCRQLSND